MYSYLDNLSSKKYIFNIIWLIKCHESHTCYVLILTSNHQFKLAFMLICTFLKDQCLISISYSLQMYFFYSIQSKWYHIVSYDFLYCSTIFVASLFLYVAFTFHRNNGDQSICVTAIANSLRIEINVGISSVSQCVNGCDSERRRRAAACRVRSPRGGGGERSVAPAWPIRLRADTNFK